MPHKDPEAALKYRKEYYQKHKRRVKDRAWKWYHDNQHRAKNRQLKKNFDITYDDYVQMLAKQNGVCAICSEKEAYKSNSGEGKLRDLSVDHNHQTGQIRGLLCAKCNAAIGMVKEEIPRLHAMIRYLESWNEVD